jgi:hypothetical protein
MRSCWGCCSGPPSPPQRTHAAWLVAASAAAGRGLASYLDKAQQFLLKGVTKLMGDWNPALLGFRGAPKRFDYGVKYSMTEVRVSDVARRYMWRAGRVRGVPAQLAA